MTTKKAKTLMVLGTSSSAGKSLMVTALCRIFARRGVKVAPFKAQNMSNNAAVCPDGSEIGRAQATQAAAAGLYPTVDMNPILIKPERDARAQIVVMGKAWTTLEAKNYYKNRDMLWKIVTQSLDRLRLEYELVIMEGAGSAAELNLRKGDIVNMEIALHANAPVILVGDIDRGGIFAQLIGTVWLLPPEERALIKGLLVNKFRGDIALFYDGVEILEEKGEVPVLGVVPYLQNLRLPEEDAVSLENPDPVRESPPEGVDIAVIHLPRISNFDDFDALDAEPGVSVRYITSPEAMGTPDAVILPGTKSTVADLEWLRAQKLEPAIREHASRGGAVVGICGGYQMLGVQIQDPNKVESDRTTLPGLDLLPVVTTFISQKATHQVEAKVIHRNGWLAGVEEPNVAGYEIHMGRTEGAKPWLEISRNGGVLDGAMSDNGNIWGCYLHGIFGNTAFRHAWLRSIGWDGRSTKRDVFAEELERLADAVEAALDMDRLEAMIWES